MIIKYLAGQFVGSCANKPAAAKSTEKRKEMVIRRYSLMVRGSNKNALKHVRFHPKVSSYYISSMSFYLK